MTRPRIAVTMGEPAGVGGETIVKALHAVAGEIDLVIAADPDWLAQAARAVDRPWPIGEVVLHPTPLTAPAIPGTPDPANASAVLAAIRWAVSAALSGAVDAVVTAPIVKSTLYAAGFDHPGHTEYLGTLCGGDHAPLMLLASETAGLRVALATIHTPLAAAIAGLTVDVILDAGLRLNAGLKQDFGIAAPRIGVAGLNPHAGEAGALGREEQTIVAPAVAALRDRGVDADGPRPADSLFHAEARPRYDAILCLYHDQGLIPLKTLDFYGGVNVTLGLPIVRASPDHGAALDIAGAGVARPDSMIAALRMAAAIARRRTSV